ncbi:MAG TPA: aspartate carbamoyltransferase [Paraburkholderia sp.]|uniref:aspartate carbamoyltransferase n=1 Tax=Paraburkholderia sp. TaxID=1926495 RepID=UPI002B479C70|nr:aspartate carbamoyltransferase [Paraburkholderia sp.]HKR45381.1 aspartate carbamoyltransferase [Paraburkholderia sp.]
MKHPTATIMVAWTAVLLGAAALSSAAIAEVTARQGDVAQQGAKVMPFSLAATTHIFTKTPDGGIQQVVAKHHDPKQVALIRGHLAGIAQQFATGDFEAPEQIHGKDMPGLAALRTAQPGELKIDYRDLPNGGEIVYRTDEPRLVAALHVWFDAQLTDHGHDAMAGHDSGMMHHHSMDASAAE